MAAALTAGLFAVVLWVLHPGYWINDDLKIAWLLAGYPGGGGASPFSVYSNTLVGLVLLPLFRLAGSRNWFSILLALTNALSTATLLYIGLSRIRRYLVRLTVCGMLVLAVGLLILEISYTVTAFLASFAGIFLVWASAQRPDLNRNEALVGCSLIVLGSSNSGRDASHRGCCGASGYAGSGAPTDSLRALAGLRGSCGAWSVRIQPTVRPGKSRLERLLCIFQREGKHPRFTPTVQRACADTTGRMDSQ